MQHSFPPIPWHPLCMCASVSLHVCETGEAAVSSAAAAQERDADSDKVLALGARVLASMIPFVAAAVLRGSLEQQLELTSRVQQLMLAAAWLATRHGVIAGPAGPAASHAGAAAAAAPVAVGGALGRIAEDPSSHPTQYHHLHRRSHASPAAGPAGATRAATGMGSKFRAGMNRLTARRAPRNAFGSGFKARLSPRSYQQQWLTRPGSRRAVSYCGNGLDAGLGGEQRLGAGDEGWGLTEDLQLQLLVAEADPVLSAEDLAHPWSWDVTQPLTLLSEGVKVRGAWALAAVDGVPCMQSSCFSTGSVSSMLSLAKCCYGLGAWML